MEVILVQSVAESATVAGFAGMRVFTHFGDVGPLAVLGKLGPPAGLLAAVAFDAIGTGAVVFAFVHAVVAQVGRVHRLLLCEVLFGGVRVF